ncbi:MAG: chemotaxis protein CheW [Paucibacter sp.]|nr:chemotaxis protein CheW [Roseateles sp.]
MAGSDTAAPAQYLTFALGEELYGLPILVVKEIIEYSTLTEVPLMPKTICGVINLRGAVVPVMDLSARLGRAPCTVGRRTSIVIVEQKHKTDGPMIGLIVDSVSAVKTVDAKDIEPPPTFGMKVPAFYISGMAKMGSKFVILLQVEQVLDLADLAPASGQELLAGPEQN